MKKKILIVLLLLLSFFYFFKDEKIEIICTKNYSNGDRKEVYLVSYAFESQINSIIKKHNSDLFNIKSNGNIRRVYLKNPIFKIKDPIFDDSDDYKKNNCSNIDNMDILCTVDKIKLKKGKDTIVFSFMFD